MLHSHAVAQRQAKGLFDRATRMFRKEPSWSITRAALLSAMDAHQHAQNLKACSNAQERTFCEHILRGAAKVVEDAEKVFKGDQS